MSLFLHRKNNLADVQDVFEARRNLGFGTMSYYDSNNVLITGGSVSVNKLCLRSSNAKPNRFLICKSNDGTVDFVDVELGPWLASNINEIKFSSFDTSDLIFQDSNTLKSVAFSGDYNDLINKPSVFSDLSNDLDFLNKDLRNIDKNGAISNLGLGTLSFMNSSDAISFDNLTINGNLIFPKETITNNPKYLILQADGTTYWDSLQKATTSQYGVVRLSDSYLDNSPNTAASIIAINGLYNYMKIQLEGIGNISLAEEIQNTITNTGLMRKNNNLSELTNIAEARSNLGFDANMENFIQSVNQNNSFNIDNFYVDSNLSFVNIDSRYTFNQDTYLAINNEGNIQPRQLLYADCNYAGFVYIVDTYEDGLAIESPFRRSVSVLSMNGLTRFVDGYYTENFASISNSIDPKIRALYHEYMRVDDNIRVDNPSIARQHLDLHPVAHTGDYFQLENAPSNLSSFSNDTGFMYRESNLLDISDINIARSNLQIGNIAYYNSNDVLILGGNGTFTNLTINNHLQYKYDDSNYQNMILTSINPNGDCRWISLPEASSVRKGIVQLETDHNNYNDSKASSASALFKVYYKLLGEIDSIRRSIDDINLVLGI